MQFRPLREVLRVCGDCQSAMERAGSLCGERGMRYEILRFAQDGEILVVWAVIYPALAKLGWGTQSGLGVKSFKDQAAR